MKTNEELLRKEEEEISKTIALSLAEYNASQDKEDKKILQMEDENDEMLQEAIRLSIINNNKKEPLKRKISVDYNDSHFNIVKYSFNNMSYYLCNNYESTKAEDDIIDNKLFWKEIYKYYKGIFIIIRDYMINLIKRYNKLNKDGSSSSSSSNKNYMYDSEEDDDDSTNSDISTLSCCSLRVIKKKYSEIEYSTKRYCKWLREGNISKRLNDHVHLSYLLSEMKLLDQTMDIHNLVFGINNYKYANDLDIRKWCNHNLAFHDHDEINFGLRQALSGPCGLISSVQGFIILILLFNYKYNFLWETNYFNVLKTNSDYLNFTDDRMGCNFEMSNFDDDIDDIKENKKNDKKNDKNKDDYNKDNKKKKTKNDDKNNCNKAIYDKEFLELVCDNIKDLKYYSLVESLAYILYQCTDKSYYIIAFVLPECYDIHYCNNRNDINENDVRELKKIKIFYKEFTNIKDIIKFYLEHFILFSSSTGVISFLYSVILTRGIENIKNDMDDTNHPLIGIYGHCSQELVNLLLTGRACSNVFDNNRVINAFSNSEVDISSTFEGNSVINNENVSDGNMKSNDNNKDKINESNDKNEYQNNSAKTNFILKGINKRPLIGLLADFEAFRYCEVGNFYKYPIYPIWVISSSNHYTVLFSLNIRNAKCTSEELYLEELNKIWKKYDKDNNKYILSQFIPSFMEELNLKEEYKNMYSNFVSVSESDILLYSDFKQFYLQVKQSKINDLKILDPPKKKYLYLYDAQENPEKSIHYFLLKEVDYEVSHTNYLKFFNTRWPNNTVEILNNGRRYRNRN